MAIDWAGLAGLGFRVFALPGGSKAPANAGWTRYAKAAASDDEVAEWAADPTLNAGIITGAVSGIVVLDLSPGLVAQITEREGAIPETPRVAAASGTHFYFAHPGKPVARLVSKRRPVGMDIAGDGRFVMAPGSLHPSGHIYAWAAAPGPDRPFAAMPEWLLAKCLDR